MTMTALEARQYSWVTTSAIRSLNSGGYSFALPLDGIAGGVNVTDVVSAVPCSVVGTAQYSASQAKFGSTSLSVGNTSTLSYISSGSTPGMQFSGDFCVAFWIWLTSAGTTETGLFDGLTVGGLGARSNTFVITYNTTNKLRLYSAGAYRITGATTITTGAWHYVELSRSGTSIYLFLDGVQQGSTYSASTNFSTGNCLLGVLGDTLSASNGITGFYDYFMAKKTAGNTGNYTPPTTPPLIMDQYGIKLL